MEEREERMMKILIVDDELLVRIALKSMIDWSAYGFELVGEAGDGKEALAMIQQHQPEIVITDIAMPHMDGLELIKQSREQDPAIHFLILSCHNDFEYVREALKLGACDYLLKLSMQPSDLLRILQELKNKIIEEEKKSKKILHLKTQLNENLNVIRKSFFLDVLKNNILNASDFQNKIENLKLRLANPYFLLVILKIDNYQKLRHENDLESDKLMDYAILNIINEVLNGYDLGEGFQSADGEFILLVSFESEVRSSAIYQQVQIIIGEILQLIRDILNISLSAGISKVAKGYKNIKYIYEQGLTSLSYGFYHGANSINVFNELKWNEAAYDCWHEKYYSTMIAALEALDFITIQNNLNNMFLYLKREKNTHPSVVKKIIKELLFEMKKIGVFYDLNIEMLLGEQDIFIRVDQCETIDELEHLIKNFIAVFVKNLDTIRSQTDRREIHMIKDYVKANFSKDITIGQMSKMVNMNPDYLSHLFKKETGIGFSEYITDIRMEKAKDYLEKGMMKVYEVGDQVGYSNANYFSKIFKQKVGVTPGEYANMKKTV